MDRQIGDKQIDRQIDKDGKENYKHPEEERLEISLENYFAIMSVYFRHFGLN